MEQKIVEVPVGYPTSTIFIDESRARAAGGRFFAVAALKVRKPGELARGMRHIRDRYSFKGEFKFKAATTGTLPIYYDALTLLESSDAHIHACVVDTDLYDPFGSKREFWQVHSDIVSQLLVGCINKRELVSVLIDGISTPADIAYDDRLKARVNQRLGATAVTSCVCLDSRSSDMLQLADLVAGAVAYDRGLQIASYKARKPEKKKLAAHLRAALGGVDFSDGRTARVNIATYRAPRRRPKVAPVRQIRPSRWASGAGQRV